MKLTNLPFRVYGDVSFRGDCPQEDMEQITVFNWLRSTYPDCLGLIALHPRNEGLLVKSQHAGMIKKKAEGMAKGAADIIIPGAITFVCELKRKDHTKSKWQDGQIEYLTACHLSGAFVCVALGHLAAIDAVRAWHGRYCS